MHTLQNHMVQALLPTWEISDELMAAAPTLQYRQELIKKSFLPSTILLCGGSQIPDHCIQNT